MNRVFHKDYGVYCCPHVFNNERSILQVIRDPDGYWQFLCGEGEDDSDKCHLVCVGHLLDRDQTIAQMVNLSKATGAERKTVDHAWEYFDL